MVIRLVEYTTGFSVFPDDSSKLNVIIRVFIMDRMLSVFHINRANLGEDTRNRIQIGRACTVA